MKRLRSISAFLIPVLIFTFALFLAACSGSGDAPGTDSPKTETSMDTPSPAKAEAPKNKGSKASGWQQAAYENYTFFLPKDWKGDGKTGLWCPGDQSLDMGRPKVSLHIGATPVMPGKSIEKGLEFYYGTVPASFGKVKKCGMNGNFVEVTMRGYKHLGLILIEDSGMKVINFFDCQALADEFEKHQETFKKILDSVGCK